MTKTIQSILEVVQIEDQLVSEPFSSVFANVWLGVLAVCLLVTLFCTLVLVSWPIVAMLVAG